MRKYFVAAVLPILVCLAGVKVLANADPSDLLDHEVVKSRIASITDILEPRYTDVVKDRLNSYLFKYPAYAQILLGRQVLYFPLFEEKLKEQGVPEDLKYLPIIESSLMPNARSRVGAVGLWQFMSGTAKLNGLKINHIVDERQNPIKASEAAAQHLKKLFEIYGDWTLVLAAYNCGPGNVNRAMKKAESNDYWEIQKYLPKETRDYIPKYIAALYLFKYYHAHGLILDLPDLDFQITERIRIHDRISFQTLADWTDLDKEVFQKLNPGFKQNYVPASYSGYEIVVPKRVAATVYKNLALGDSELFAVDTEEDGSPEDLEREYQEISLDVYDGESLEDIATHYNINVYNIKYWNQISHNESILQSPQLLTLYVYAEKSPVVEIPSYRPVREQNKIDAIPHIDQVVKIRKTLENQSVATFLATLQSSAPLSENMEGTVKTLLENRKRIRLRKGQSVGELIKEIPAMTMEKLLALNEINDLANIKAGMYFYIE